MGTRITEYYKNICFGLINIIEGINAMDIES